MRAIVCLWTLITLANGARILGVFPYPSHSHQVVFKTLSMELAKRGHEVITFTTHPTKNLQLANYTEVSLDFLNNYKEKLNFFETGGQGVWSFLHAVYKFGGALSDETLSHPVMQQLLSPKNTLKIDLILVQSLYQNALYGLSIHLNAPMIGVSSLPMLAIHHYMFGNPLALAYSPDAFLGCTDNMNLWERIVNVYYTLRQLYEYERIVLPPQQALVRKHFGDKMPHVRELSKQLSLIFTYSHPFYAYPRPDVPKVVHIGGIRTGKTNNTLPKDIKEILDKSTQGVIYFSLGSNLKSSHLPLEILNTLLDTFRELPYIVIWKFETDEITNKPTNVITRKWLPQQEILAHPNIVLFMYQGGLQSTEEAIDNALPVIGFPLFSDQNNNLNRLQSLGIAKRMDLLKVEKAALKSAILEVITDSRYKENAVKLRDLLRDLPYHPMEHAVWWVEHVIRHKGTPHLHSRSQDMPLYQLLLLDVIAIFAVSAFILLYLSFVITRFAIKKSERVVAFLKVPNITVPKKKE